MIRDLYRRLGRSWGRKERKAESRALKSTLRRILPDEEDAGAEAADRDEPIGESIRIADGTTIADGSVGGKSVDESIRPATVPPSQEHAT